MAVTAAWLCIRILRYSSINYGLLQAEQIFDDFLLIWRKIGPPHSALVYLIQSSKAAKFQDDRDSVLSLDKAQSFRSTKRSITIYDPGSFRSKILL